MMENCGISISRECEVLGQISEYYNNPDISDVTLKVGEQSYFAHRFVLAAQSSVFRSMLIDDKWKESNEKVIQLEESLEGERAFGDFIKFFYTGKLTFQQDSVCDIHMLADKYDVQLLVKDAKTFMKEVLTGVHGEACQNSLKWLAYIELFIPDLLPTCYEAIQTNFYGYRYNTGIETLESHHLKQILTSLGTDKDLVIWNELVVFKIVAKWAKSKFGNLSRNKAKSELKTILPLIRFHNMKDEDLQEVKASELCRAVGERFINQYVSSAYKVHSQMLSLVGKVSKNKRLSGGAVGAAVEECKCLCDSSDVCPHFNPRFYFNRFGHSYYVHIFKSFRVKPIDLDDLATYVRLFTEVEESQRPEWTFTCEGNYQSSGSYVNEKFVVDPVVDDIGRKFTIVVMLHGPKTKGVFRYVVKHTDIVQHSRSLGAKSIEIKSPYRLRGLWDISNDDDMFWVGAAVHLHKR